jgi:hypothetical protein
VQVKIKYAGVNPSDVFSLTGRYPGFTRNLPAVPGIDGEQHTLGSYEWSAAGLLQACCRSYEWSHAVVLGGPSLLIIHMPGSICIRAAMKSCRMSHATNNNSLV